MAGDGSLLAGLFPLAVMFLKVHLFEFLNRDVRVM